MKFKNKKAEAVYKMAKDIKDQLTFIDIEGYVEDDTLTRIPTTAEEIKIAKQGYNNLKASLQFIKSKNFKNTIPGWFWETDEGYDLNDDYYTFEVAIQSALTLTEERIILYNIINKYVKKHLIGSVKEGKKLLLDFVKKEKTLEDLLVD